MKTTTRRSIELDTIEAQPIELEWLYRQSHQLTLTIIRLGRRFPSEERKGLAADLRRASAGLASCLKAALQFQSRAARERALNKAQIRALETEALLALLARLDYLHPYAVRLLLQHCRSVRDALAGRKIAETRMH